MVVEPTVIVRGSGELSSCFSGLERFQSVAMASIRHLALCLGGCWSCECHLFPYNHPSQDSIHRRQPIRNLHSVLRVDSSQGEGNTQDASSKPSLLPAEENTSRAHQESNGPCMLLCIADREKIEVVPRAFCFRHHAIVQTGCQGRC